MGNKSNDAAREPRLSPSIKDLAAKAKQAAVKAQGTVLKAVDKNGNGKIDAEDFGITKESMQDAAQKLKASANRIGESLNDAKTELDRRVLRPVFKEDLYPDSFSGDLLTAVQIPNLICIVGHDKKRTDSAVCVGAIGYWTSVKGAELLNLYEDSAALLGLQFLPSIAETFYYTLNWVPQGNGTRDVYYLEKVGQGGEKNWYLFSGLCYRLYNDQEGTDSILFPGLCLDAPDDDILKLSYDTPYLCDPVTVGGQAWEDILQETSAFYESTGYFDAVWQDPILSVRGKGTARNIPALTLRFDTVEEQTYVTILQPD